MTYFQFPGILCYLYYIQWNFICQTSLRPGLRAHSLCWLLVDIYDTSILMTCGRLYILKEIILSIFIRIRMRHIIFLATVPCKVGFISSLPFHWGYNIGGSIILLWGSLKYDFSPYTTIRLCLLSPCCHLYHSSKLISIGRCSWRQLLALELKFFFMIFPVCWILPTSLTSCYPLKIYFTFLLTQSYIWNIKKYILTFLNVLDQEDFYDS